MYLTTLDAVTQVSQQALTLDPASLYKELEKVKDRRGKKGKRYPLALVLTLLLLGKLAGETTLDAITDWIHLRKSELRKLLNWPKSFPSHKTYSRILSLCDDKEIVSLITGVIEEARARELCEDEPSRLVKQREEEERLVHLAADGKTLRGTLKHAAETMPSVHILTLYDCHTGITTAQYVYKNEESELSAANRVLSSGLIKGSVITTDDLYTHKKWCAWIDVQGGYYRVAVKKNTPVTYKDLADYFGESEILKHECHYFQKAQKGHVRREKREIWTSTHMNEWFGKEWTGIAQVFMIRKTVIEKGEKRVIIRYGMTNLAREKANAKRILELRQNHWRIENCSHYRRDVTLGEDACQVRMNQAPEVLAALNGGILALMDFLGVKNVAKQMRYYSAKQREALQLLCGNLFR